jgi:hypothetical protein
VSKYLVSYAYKDSKFGIGRTVLELKNIDITLLEFEIKNLCGCSEVVIINVVKLKIRNNNKSLIIQMLKILFPKTYTKLQFKRAIKQEFSC